MPALRTTRQSNRTSRTSSPYVHSPNDAADPPPAKHPDRVDADAWDEPPLKDPVPSFEEHGLDRVGVLETMAPLGSLPSVPARPRTKEPARRSTLSRSVRGNLSEDALDSSAKTTPSAPASRSQSQRPEGDRGRDASEPKDEVDDEDYVPNGHGPTTRQTKPVQKLSISFNANHAKPAPSRQSRRGTQGRDRLLKEAVAAAVKIAEGDGNTWAAIMMRTLLDHRTREVAVDDLIHDIMHQRPLSDSQVELMRRFFALAKKRMKSTRSRDRGYIKSITSLAATEKRQHTQNSPRPAAVQDPFTSVTLDSKTPRSTKLSPPPAAEPVTRSASKRKSPRKTMAANGVENPPDVHTPITRGRERADSISSTSSLSSVDEAIVEEGSPNSAALRSLLGRGGAARARGPFSDLNGKVAKAFGKQTMKKRSREEVSAEAAAENARRKRLMRSFPDYRVEPSAIRPDTQPARVEEFTPPITRSARRSLAAAPLSAPPLPYAFADSSREASPREGRRVKTAARVKTSPVKRRNVGGTGSGRSTGARGSPAGREESDELLSDNEESCKACGVGGLLVVCDHCESPFHLLCADPPLEESSQRLDNPWFCNPCASRGSNPRRYERTLFQPLLLAMDAASPCIFKLPAGLDTYFDGVRAGSDGEYDDAVPAERIKSRNPFDESAYLRLKDNKDASIICDQCGGSSITGRPIVQCDECKANWHLDCVTPPMANPPAMRSDGKSRNRFVCPRHVSHDLRMANNDFGVAQRQRLVGERLHRFRRPARANVVDTNLRPSQLPGSALIDVADDTDPCDEFSDDEESRNVVYRVGSQKVRLDFFNRIKQDPARFQDLVASERSPKRRRVDTPPVESNTSKIAKELSKHSFLDQRTALDLISFAERESDLGLTGDSIESLILGLISEAPDAVVEQLDHEPKSTDYSTTSGGQGPPSPPISERAELSDDQARLYEKLQQLIARRLQGRTVKDE